MSKVDSLKPRKFIHLGALRAQTPTETQNEEVTLGHGVMRLRGFPCPAIPRTAFTKPTSSHGQFVTGVPRLQDKAPPWDLTVELCLGPYGGPREWTFSYERGTPARLPMY